MNLCIILYEVKRDFSGIFMFINYSPCSMTFFRVSDPYHFDADPDPLPG